MRRSGADAARSGFVDQAAVMLHDALADSSWTHVELEPAWSEKVDISWNLSQTNGSTVRTWKRDVQVKSYTTTVVQSQIEDWCSDLDGNSSAEDKHLIVVGPLGSSASSTGTHANVTYFHRADRIAAIHNSTIAQLLVFVQERGDEALLHDLHAAVVDLLNNESIGGKSWTRESLFEVIRSQLQAIREARRRSAHRWHVNVKRTSFVRHTGMVYELVRYSLTNRGHDAALAKLELELTDALETELLHLSVAPGFDEYVVYPDTPRAAPYVVTTKIETPSVSPGGCVWWGFVFRRWGTVRRLSTKWILSDPLMPMPQTHEAQVKIIVEGLGSWRDIEPPARVHGQSVAWSAVVAGDLGTFHAEWIPDGAARLDPEALQALKDACLELGLEGIPDDFLL